MNRLWGPTLLLAAVVLGGCSEAEDALSDAASDAGNRAACAVAKPPIDEGRDLVGRIAADIGAEPAAAARELTALREALSLAEVGLSGDVRDQIARAGDALDSLRAEAESAADGTTIDEKAVEAARAEYDAAVAGITGIC